MDKQTEVNLLKMLAEPLKTKHDIKFYGELLFQFATEKGIPPEVVMDELEKRAKFSDIEKAHIINIYLRLFTLHKIKSGFEIGSERHKKLVERNKKILLNVLRGKGIDTL